MNYEEQQKHLTALRAEAKQQRRRKGHVPTDLTRQIAKLERLVTRTPVAPPPVAPPPVAPPPLPPAEFLIEESPAPKQSTWKKTAEPDVQDDVEGV